MKKKERNATSNMSYTGVKQLGRHQFWMIWWKCCKSGELFTEVEVNGDELGENKDMNMFAESVYENTF